MNFKKFINSDYLKSNPLCGIGTYKDELNLATGDCTRKIKKLVLTGEENITSGHLDAGLFNIPIDDYIREPIISLICTHYIAQSNVEAWTWVSNKNTCFYVGSAVDFRQLYIRDSSYSTIADFKAYLTAQYAAGTPVTVWYVLAEPTTETITVPSGLSGTEEGYLNQSGTPTPTNPIYPTANTVEQWFDLNHYIMRTSTDTITTPADIYVNDTTATVGLKGNMEQASGVSPTNPIQPSECGERTGNLINIYANNTSNGYVNNALLRSDDSTYTPSSMYISEYLPIEDNKTYTYYTGGITGEAQAICFYNAAKKYISGISYNNQTAITFTTPQGTKYYRCTVMRAASDTESYKKTMLNSGSTALPYEPYGYKIPISSASTTTPVYLGEVQTTRKIKKLVFGGTENWQTAIELDARIFYIPNSQIPDNKIVCTHYVVRGWDDAKSNDNSINVSFTYARQSINVHMDTYSTVSDFKSYLQQQYAAGTPVTVWYVLATPETGIVNEPLRKIGDYADEVSGITIPTIAGANTISVDTTLQPSEVTVNYKGWHPVADVHERESGAWT